MTCIENRELHWDEDNDITADYRGYPWEWGQSFKICHCSHDNGIEIHGITVLPWKWSRMERCYRSFGSNFSHLG